MKKYIKRKCRLIKQFFKITKFKKGQIIQFPRNPDQPVQLDKFIRYNNVGEEVWRFVFVKHPELTGVDLLYGKLIVDGVLTKVSEYE